MSSPPNLEALGVRVDRLEKEVDEIKVTWRENQKLLTDAILSIEKHGERQTAHMEILQQHVMKQDQQINKLDEKVDTRFEKMDEKLDQVNMDVLAIKTRSETISKITQDNNSKSKFWSFMDSYGRYLLVVMILLLLGGLLVAGVKPNELIKFIV